MAVQPGKITDILMEEEKPLDMRYYLHLFRKKVSVIITFFIIAVTIAGIYAAKIPTRYQATAKMVLEMPRTAWQSGAEEDSYRGYQEPQSLSDTFFNTQKEIMLGSSVLEEVSRELRLQAYFETENIEEIIQHVRRMTDITSPAKSRLVSITVIGKDPRLAARLANSIAQNFIRKTFEDRLYYNQDVLSWLEQGNPDGSGFVTITDPFGNAKSMKYEDLVNSLPAVQTDANIRALKNQLQELQVELDNMLRKYREKHPLIIKARANMRFIEENIEAEKKRIIKTLKSRARGQLESKPGRVVEEAKIPQAPLKTNRWRLLIIAGVASIVLAMAIIFALDYFDDTVHIMEDFERKGILIPFLGPLPLIPALERAKARVPVLTNIDEEAEDRLAVEEAFRYLRVAINFSAPPETVKTLAITSCLPGDGKSFVSTNLACSLALDGNRVLLIDGDMRRPVIHSTLNMENDTGLSNYLTANVKLESVVRESQMENLSVISSGPISPNPSEILGSDRMKSLLKEASASYDRIIIDCPPLTGIGDGFVMGGLVGHLILVVGAGKTPADLIRHIQQQLDKMEIKVLGTILNRMDLSKERYGGYTRHYYSTYHKYYRRKA